MDNFNHVANFLVVSLTDSLTWISLCWRTFCGLCLLLAFFQSVVSRINHSNCCWDGADASVIHGRTSPTREWLRFLWSFMWSFMLSALLLSSFSVSLRTDPRSVSSGIAFSVDSDLHCSHVGLWPTYFAFLLFSNQILDNFLLWANWNFGDLVLTQHDNLLCIFVQGFRDLLINDHFVFGTLRDDPSKVCGFGDVWFSILPETHLFSSLRGLYLWTRNATVHRFLTFLDSFIQPINNGIERLVGYDSDWAIRLITYRMIFRHSVFLCLQPETTRFHTLAGVTCLAESFFSTLLLK
jgi:hypothetical protein